MLLTAFCWIPGIVFGLFANALLTQFAKVNIGFIPGVILGFVVGFYASKYLILGLVKTVGYVVMCVKKEKA
ncbi:MAG: hypothetical protein GC134_00795 [Proteobacteria bacterium]|nr:hypothetical protein [Pseudomonadota bacterium]